MAAISAILNGKEIVTSKAAVRAILVVSFVVMTALGAHVRIPLPFSPVPITLQTFFVLLCGATLGRKFGTLAQGGYVGLGVLGIPLFQGYGAGLLHLAGPTGGYLIGFIAAPFIVGSLIKRNVVFAMSLGLSVIYVCGVSWLMLGYKFDFSNAVYLGFIPFIPGAVCKLIAASWIYSKIRVRCEQVLR